MAKKERLRFYIHDDLILLREVYKQNPYIDRSRWKNIHRVVLQCTQKQFSLRAIREHAEYLLKLWNKNGRSNLRKSGSEEQYNEKEFLLDKIIELTGEFRNENEAIPLDIYPSRNSDTFLMVNNTSTDCSLEPLYLDSIKETPAEEKYSPTDNSDHTFEESKPIEEAEYSVTSEKFDTDNTIQSRLLDIQERKLALEERRLLLEEEKFKLEVMEKERRLEIEIKEREQRLDLAERQQRIIEIMIQDKLKNVM